MGIGRQQAKVEQPQVSAATNNGEAGTEKKPPSDETAMETGEVEVDDTPLPAVRTVKPTDLSKLWRNVLADKPRVTRFQIPWDAPEQVPQVMLDGNSNSIDFRGEASNHSFANAVDSTPMTE